MAMTRLLIVEKLLLIRESYRRLCCYCVISVWCIVIVAELITLRPIGAVEAILQMRSMYCFAGIIAGYPYRE